MRFLTVLLVFGVVCCVSCFQNIGGKLYYIEHYDKLDWFDARDKCKSMNAHLVSIQNFGEWHAIAHHLRRSLYWVDIRDVNSNHYFISDTSGREAPFFMWSHGQPLYKHAYDCVKLRASNRKMKTKNCSQKNHYICEANSRPVTPPVTAAPIEHHPSQGYEILDKNVLRTRRTG